MTDWKKSFLESSVLGRATNKDCPSEVLKRCIELAYSDMMTAGRYYSASFLNNKDEICLATNRAIIESNFVFSRKIIEDISLNSLSIYFTLVYTVIIPKPLYFLSSSEAGQMESCQIMGQTTANKGELLWK